MTTVDKRIKNRALQIAERDALNRRHDLDELRGLIDDEVYNMQMRGIEERVPKEKLASWLHMKMFDDTYHDWGQAGRRRRTRQRIKNLLTFCQGDRELLLREYAQALDRRFPIPGATYRWAPRLIERTLDGGRERVTMEFRWKRLSD